jgi:ribonucleoside-diphosphate reductase alpha chain
MAASAELEFEQRKNELLSSCKAQAEAARPSVKKAAKLEFKDKTICPECGCKLILEEGCCNCKGCGYSRCG